MTIISIIDHASDPAFGRDLEAYESGVDKMFDIIERDTAGLTSAARKRFMAQVNAIIDADNPLPITATMRAGMKAVRLVGGNGMATVTDRFWRGYARKHGA